MTQTTGVNSGVTVEAFELGYKDTLLKTGYEANVMNTLNDFFDSEKGLLCSYDGKQWGILMDSGPKKDQIFYLPSCNPEGCGGTVP